jgi:Sulfotransferase domain
MTHENQHPPDFLYVGTSKAGSTWLFNVLAGHPDVYLASDKGLYYFDAHFDRGADWYLDHFRDSNAAVRGEVSHSYLSSPEAPARIAALAPGARLLVCLREPVDRAFSDYLDLRKNQQFDGPFAAALERYPRLLDRGCYATHLRRYLDVFPREQLLVQLFDDLKADPQAYADRVFDFLGVSRVVLPQSDLRSRMPAGVPRSNTAAAAAKSASRLVRRTGLRRLRSRVKRSALVRQALYRPYADDRPVPDADTANQLRRVFAPQVAELDNTLDLSVSRRWGYDSSDERSTVR